MRTPRRPDPEVMESDYRIPTALGTLAWAIALVVLLVRGDGLAVGERWWIWVCAVGIALGVFGYFYVPHLLGKRAAAEERRERERADASEAPDNGPRA
ncbi:DUF2530 domain-containing protein [Nocardiopsis sp. RSe5-2]|uniref:DUF2530 domain-containing protein n=2 Tax=Nocardiopsis endophytica TaxID=3018445 RepID=A0ABT4TZL0_9ACTN|nr:DUF2530 domain-containing protein [Nocardiopsis endophytica]MDA2809674.1 DUF2530 domain-containing protein [Nocardiopsis endophytica]